MKSVRADRAEVQGRFEWMRDDILAVVGGNFFYETPKHGRVRERADDLV